MLLEIFIGYFMSDVPLVGYASSFQTLARKADELENRTRLTLFGKICEGRVRGDLVGSILGEARDLV